MSQIEDELNIMENELKRLMEDLGIDVEIIEMARKRETKKLLEKQKVCDDIIKAFFSRMSTSMEAADVPIELFSVTLFKFSNIFLGMSMIRGGQNKKDTINTFKSLQGLMADEFIKNFDKDRAKAKKEKNNA